MRKTDKTNTDIIRYDTVKADGAEYHYTLTANHSPRVASYQLTLYSIHIKMIYNGKITENSAVDIFSDVGRALSFYRLLLDNLVTPIDLPYIIQDKISI